MHNPELKNGKRPYLHLWIAVPQGYGEKQNTIFLDVVFFDDDARRIIKCGVKKHSLLEIAGDIEEIEAYADKESGELRTALKIRPYRWQFVPGAKAAVETAATEEAELPPPPQIECTPDGRMPF